jgi:hypothetical protein
MKTVFCNHLFSPLLLYNNFNEVAQHHVRITSFYTELIQSIQVFLSSGKYVATFLPREKGLQHVFTIWP